MTEPTNAEKHAKIAEKVWPDVEWYACENVAGAIVLGDDRHSGIIARFNLLATNLDGSPSTQAKADALDVLVWLNTNGTFHAPEMGDERGWGIIEELGPYDRRFHFGETVCEAIFNAAWGVVKDD